MCGLLFDCIQYVHVHKHWFFSFLFNAKISNAPGACVIHQARQLLFLLIISNVMESKQVK